MLDFLNISQCICCSDPCRIGLASTMFVATSFIRKDIKLTTNLMIWCTSPCDACGVAIGHPSLAATLWLYLLFCKVGWQLLFGWIVCHNNFISILHLRLELTFPRYLLTRRNRIKILNSRRNPDGPLSYWQPSRNNSIKSVFWLRNC